MLRWVFAGVLAVSALSCKGSKDDAPAVAVSAPAGKVVEITGKVEATRAGKTRELVIASEVFADDQIATADNATVTIELFHNNARWAVVSNKKARVDASLAWGLDKQQATKSVEHSSAAAGRNAERSAADTSATAEERSKNVAPPAVESVPTPTAAAPGGPPADMPVQPPPPPPPPPKVERQRAEPKLDRSAPKAPLSTRGGSPADKDGVSAGAPLDLARDNEADDSAQIKKLVDAQRAELKKCLAPEASKVAITVRVVKGKVTVTLSGSGNLTDKVRACAETVVAKLPLATLSGTTVVDFR